jgi:hypothetical protein
LHEELTGEVEHFLEAEGAGEKADPGGFVVGRGFRGAAEDENGNLGEAGVEFGDKLGTANSGHLEAGDDEAKIAGKLRLFDQAESLGCIADALHIVETPFE